MTERKREYGMVGTPITKREIEDIKTTRRLR